MAAKTGNSNKALIPIIGVGAALAIAAVAWALLGGGESDEPVITPAPPGRVTSQEQVQDKPEPTKPRGDRVGRRTVESPEDGRGRTTPRMDSRSARDKDNKNERRTKKKKPPAKKKKSEPPRGFREPGIG